VRIALTNCNTTAAMTGRLVRGARAAAGPGTLITGHTPRWGPESAEGWLDSYLSAAAVLDLLRQIEEPVDAVVMAGFGEHGREGARELLDVPVVDITEAAAHLACLLGHRYGVVTTLPRTVGQIRDSLRGAGVGENCASVVATGIGVLDLDVDQERTAREFIAAGRRALDAGAEVLVLGCAGMTGLEQRVSAALGTPVVDGVAAAVRLAETLVALGLTTSRIGSFAKPLPKQRIWGPPGRD
jgi:allantoin racemase